MCRATWPYSLLILILPPVTSSSSFLYLTQGTVNIRLRSRHLLSSPSDGKVQVVFWLHPTLKHCWLSFRHKDLKETSIMLRLLTPMRASEVSQGTSAS